MPDVENITRSYDLGREFEPETEACVNYDAGEKSCPELSPGKPYNPFVSTLGYSEVDYESRRFFADVFLQAMSLSYGPADAVNIANEAVAAYKKV